MFGLNIFTFFYNTESKGYLIYTSQDDKIYTAFLNILMSEYLSEEGRKGYPTAFLLYYYYITGMFGMGRYMNSFYFKDIVCLRASKRLAGVF